MIVLNEKTHQYFNKNREYISVSRLIEMYQHPFDTDFWATFKALESLIGKEKFYEIRKHRNWKSAAFIEWACSLVNQNALLKKIDSFKEAWEHKRNHSQFKGKAYHSRKEEESFQKGEKVNPFTGKKVKLKAKKSKGSGSITFRLQDLEDGFYPELVLWNDKYRIAGTADMVFIETIGLNRYADLDDYKTNEEITKENPFQTFRAPLETFEDTKYNHYRFQISLYAWMMEQQGFHIMNTSFTHFNKQYKFSYFHMRKFIEKMLNHYAKRTN